MEKFPNQNQESGREKIDKEKVLRALREGGLNDREAKKLVLAWTEQQEEIAENSENRVRSYILLNISRCDLYLAVGDKEGAISCLEEAYYQANQFGEKDFCDEIESKINDIIDSK